MQPLYRYVAVIPIALGALLWGCGDEGVIATNEPETPPSVGGQGGGPGVGGVPGQGGTWPAGPGGAMAAGGTTSAGAGPGGAGPGGAGPGGAGGTAQGGVGGVTGGCTNGQMMDLGACARCGRNVQLCENNQWSAPMCVDQGVCEAGVTDQEACGNCGTRIRTCSTLCEWGTFGACSGQGECAPGAETTTGCSDPCQAKTCGSNCTFGACGLKSGATCEFNGGSNFQCCGAGKWQFCSSSTCTWFPCQSCQGNCSCS